MKHSVVFRNSDNFWDNALPLGNGCFGAMIYYEKHKLYMPMNHYEIYYNTEKNTLLEDKLRAAVPIKDAGGRFNRFKAQALGNMPKENEPFCDYNFNKSKISDKNYYNISKFSGSYPATGALIYSFSEKLQNAEQELILYVEDAKAELSLTDGKNSLLLDTAVMRDDCIVNHIHQTESELITSVEISFPPQRDLKHPDVTYEQIDSTTFAYTVTRKWDSDNSFIFSGIIRLCGSKGKLSIKKDSAEILLYDTKKEFYVLTGIFTDFKYKNPLSGGLAAMNGYSENLKTMYDEHKDYWTEFFARSNISIPDRFLENIYYINQYALDCSSGKDGVMKHHACGLNGLWDVHHPNLWGSMWYWDVNIQAAFAGTFSSNRLDLAKVFSDGLLSYVPLAELFSLEVHNIEGLAGDYPHCCYYCMWAWCAQYLWLLYEYSLDKEYLKNEAFPLFIKLCEFYLRVFEYDEKKGYYSIFPDISPEQGPFVHDSVITVSSVKYLFKFTLKAAEILNIDLPLLSKCRKVMNNMAPYPTSGDGMYGVHLKDAEDAPDNMWIRHPSMLMPLFPIGEEDLLNKSEALKILSNTVDFLEERMEIGIFGGSWLAAAAARLGRGQTALRIIYEHGIDHMLRSNGLAAEETDHFINHCLVPRQPLYYPCMMEFSGGMLAAVNEMLLQSHNGIINVFPALPDGNPEYERLHRHGYPINEYYDRFAEYEPWDTLHFENLLAKGAFLASASMTDKKLDYIKLHSQKGGKLRLSSPYISDALSVFSDGKAIKYENKDNVICFDTEANTDYLITAIPSCAIYQNVDCEYTLDVLSRETYMKRKIFLGGNLESEYQKSLDYFIRDWYVGNVRMDNHTVYKFDFSKTIGKQYNCEVTRQAFVAEEKAHYALPFNIFADSDFEFSAFRGFGFDDASKVTLIERSGPDLLRKDFVQGTESAEFIIEAPRGQYELFVVSGDSDEDSVTILEAINGRHAGGKLIKKGHYQCKLLPLVNESDEPIRLKISTKSGYQWKLNYLMLNRIKGY